MSAEYVANKLASRSVIEPNNVALYQCWLHLLVWIIIQVTKLYCFR